MVQPVQYMTMVNGHYIHVRATATIGLLLDHMAVRFAFSVLCSSDGKATSLPVIFVSPPVKWRTGVLLSRAVCIAMCVLQSLKLQRLPVGQEWADTWNTITEVTLRLKRENFIVSKSRDGILYDFLQTLDTWNTITEVTLRVKRENFIVSTSRDGILYDFLQTLGTMQNTMDMHNKKV